MRGPETHHLKADEAMNALLFAAVSPAAEICLALLFAVGLSLLVALAGIAKATKRLRKALVPGEPASHSEQSEGVRVFKASEAWKEISPHVKQNGTGAIAFSTLINPEFEHFYLPGAGSIAFVQISDCYRDVTIVCGNPLTDPARWSDITRLFLREHPNASFWYVTKPYGKILSELGFYIDDYGTEPNVLVQEFEYGARTRQIRRDARNARGSGLRVKELRPEDLTLKVCEQLQKVSGKTLHPNPPPGPQCC